MNKEEISAPSFIPQRQPCLGLTQPESWGNNTQKQKHIFFVLQLSVCALKPCCILICKFSVHYHPGRRRNSNLCHFYLTKRKQRKAVLCCPSISAGTVIILSRVFREEKQDTSRWGGREVGDGEERGTFACAWMKNTG